MKDNGVVCPVCRLYFLAKPGSQWRVTQWTRRSSPLGKVYQCAALVLISHEGSYNRDALILITRVHECDSTPAPRSPTLAAPPNATKIETLAHVPGYVRAWAADVVELAISEQLPADDERHAIALVHALRSTLKTHRWTP